MNRLGLCISYDKMEKIDNGLAQRTINIAGVNRTPIPSIIKNNVLLHGAMDNFDHDENTPSGIGGSHDTILMVFQNDQNKSNEKSAEISQMPQNFPSKKRALDCILPCQKLLKRGKFAGRGTILESFTPSKDIDFRLLNNNSEKEHSLWVLSRHIRTARSIPSFTALKSLLTVNKYTVSSIAFTPIIPHPATSYDTIFTAMINFQDILKQKGLAKRSIMVR